MPIALHSEYRPPTQSQNWNIFWVSIPNSETFCVFVLNAMKCLAIASSGANCRNHFLADLAFVIVSCVVNVFDAIMKSVVSAELWNTNYG